MILVSRPLPVGGRFDGWSHLWSSSHDLGELQAFGARLGLKPGWLQMRPGFPHFDISPAKRRRALELGAVEMSERDFMRRDLR